MRVCVLGSGSGGNSTLIEGGGTVILLDAGLSYLRVRRELAMLDIDPERVDAILLT
ncbi:MAG: MBL fold metallo-hydrolase, partial [Thermoplasmata archaeon]|nr:MBL fold metallo-hydrolase [Thermoplasmata archaeon]NIY02340.1 MBL fold metallo-hydrolase [Thermoplasmata archaeon]